MKCPYCGSEDSRVTDKRDTEDSLVTRRRRECQSCGKRFTTYERVETVELTVMKKDGRRQQFDKSKILSGLLHACEKRPISRKVIDDLVDKIETELKGGEKKEISSKEIGDLVIRNLRKIDKVAYIRFASVYREFEDIDSFQKELNKLKKIKEVMKE
ncbi:MAG: transcriptional regulator NrdR [Candidatus Aenigmatarchaeota archaeon]|nr:transcriptional regulator NrdR [Nanoarchaeota archaeon]